jgi:hypothetical protein
MMISFQIWDAKAVAADGPPELIAKIAVIAKDRRK